MDRLDGYRGIRPESLRRATEAPQPTEREQQYRRLVLGIEAEKLMAGIANAEEIGHVMAEIVAACEARIREATGALLGIEDLTSKEARTLHFDAAVCAAVITMLNNLINSGRTAGQQLQQENDEP